MSSKCEVLILALEMILETCDGCHDRKSLKLLAYCGAFCDECYSVLSEPFLLENVISSPSVALLAEGLSNEVRGRQGRLRSMALQVIENRRAADVP